MKIKIDKTDLMSLCTLWLFTRVLLALITFKVNKSHAEVWENEWMTSSRSLHGIYSASLCYCLTDRACCQPDHTVYLSFNLYEVIHRLFMCFVSLHRYAVVCSRLCDSWHLLLLLSRGAYCERDLSFQVSRALPCQYR